MLVLTRKKSEMIHIGDNIVIKVISTGKGKVKIGIEAPGEIRVMRAEMLGESPTTANSHEQPRAASLRVNRIHEAMNR